MGAQSTMTAVLPFAIGCIVLTVLAVVLAFKLITAYELADERWYEVRLLAQQCTELRRYKDVMVDASVVNWSLTAENEANAKRLLNDILRTEIEMALDPSISSEARALVDRERAACANAVADVPFTLRGKRNYSARDVAEQMRGAALATIRRRDNATPSQEVEVHEDSEAALRREEDPAFAQF